MARRRYSFFDEDFLARLQRLHLIAKRLTARGYSGTRRSRRLGDGLEFADHRSYAPGDDIRFVDWPYYARMERLLLRLFHQRSEADVVILLDTSASMAPGGATVKFDYARRVAAAMAFVAMGGLERVIVQPFAAELGEPLRAGRSRGHILAVLDYLGGLSPAGRTALKRCVDRYAARGEPAATVLLVSDLLDCGEDLSTSLAHLRGRGDDVTVLHVFSPLDATGDLQGPTLLRQAETGLNMTLQITPAVRESYRRRWEEFRAAVEHTTVARGAVYAAAGCDVPFEQLVLRTLRRAGVLTP